MGEYALYEGQQVKIGTCEHMFGLRAAQLSQVTQAPGGINLDVARDALLFRFPFPDEDGTPPGHYRDCFRSLPLEFCHLDDTVYEHDRDDCTGPLALYLQRYWKDRLVTVIHCDGCGHMWRLPSLDDAQPVIDSLHAMAEVAATSGAEEYAVFLRSTADRVTAGYGTEYPSLRAFYDANPARLSGEAEYGVGWQIIATQDGPGWRVFYARDTGEVCAAFDGDGLVRVLGIVPADDPATDPDGRGRYFWTLDVILAGWGDRDVTGERLAWIIQRLGEAGRLA